MISTSWPPTSCSSRRLCTPPSCCGCSQSCSKSCRRWGTWTSRNWCSSSTRPTCCSTMLRRSCWRRSSRWSGSSAPRGSGSISSPRTRWTSRTLSWASSATGCSTPCGHTRPRTRRRCGPRRRPSGPTRRWTPRGPSRSWGSGRRWCRCWTGRGCPPWWRRRPCSRPAPGCSRCPSRSAPRRCAARCSTGTTSGPWTGSRPSRSSTSAGSSAASRRRSWSGAAAQREAPAYYEQDYHPSRRGTSARRPGGRSTAEQLLVSMGRSAVSSVGSSIGRQLVRGLMGSLLGGGRR